MLHDNPVESMLENNAKYKVEDFDHFLIIWWGLPEIMEFYLIPNIPEMRIPEWLPLVDNFIQNTMNVPEHIHDHINTINDALCSDKSICVDPEHPLSGKWSDYMVPLGPIAVPDKTLVITTGYCM
jgi:hypothetical protein